MYHNAPSDVETLETDHDCDQDVCPYCESDYCDCGSMIAAIETGDHDVEL